MSRIISKAAFTSEGEAIQRVLVRRPFGLVELLEELSNRVDHVSYVIVYLFRIRTKERRWIIQQIESQGFEVSVLGTRGGPALTSSSLHFAVRPPRFVSLTAKVINWPHNKLNEFALMLGLGKGILRVQRTETEKCLSRLG